LEVGGHKQHKPSPVLWSRRAVSRFFSRAAYDIREFAEAVPRILFNRWILGLLVLIVLFVSYLPPTITFHWTKASPWYVESHRSWLDEHRIVETTWILDYTRDNHTSNDPSSVGDVKLQFPQKAGKVEIVLEDVEYDPRAHYGAMSITEFQRDSAIDVTTLINKKSKKPMGVELHGTDVVATIWGNNTFILTAWSKHQPRWWREPREWWWSGRVIPTIPAETMLELVEKHRGTRAITVFEDEWDQPPVGKPVSSGIFIGWGRMRAADDVIESM